MKRILFLLWMGMMAVSFFSFAEIAECRSLEECFASLKLQEGDLVVFDVDLTLVMATDPAILPSQVKKHYSVFKELMPPTQLMKSIALDLIARRVPMRLIDPSTPQLIEKIQKMGVPVIALTALGMHPLGLGQAVPEWRFDQLKRMGIQFSNPTKSASSIPLEGCVQVLGFYPTYYRGILVSNPWGEENDKGKVLMAFLPHLTFKPKRIIFVDDSKRNVEAMESSFKQSGIAFSGWHFTSGASLSLGDVPVLKFKKEWGRLIQDAEAVIEEFALSEMAMCGEPSTAP